MSRRIVLLLVAAARASALPLEAAEPHAADAGGKIVMPAGYSQILFQDDFSGVGAGSLPSPSKWTVDTGTSYPGGPARWGTNEVQTYTSSPANLAVNAAGNLVITPLLSAGPRGVWTSGRVETTAANDFACAPGRRLRMEARLRVGGSGAAQQMGIWPAFWSLGAAYRGNYWAWPAVGEMDILESPNGEARAWQTLHCGSASGGPCRETTGISSTAALSRGDWHTAAVEIDRTGSGGAGAAGGGGDWRKEELVWLVDGQPTMTVTGDQVGNASAWEPLARAPKFLLLNVAVGGSLPNAVAKVTTPNAGTRGGSGAALEVSYVAVFSS